MSQGNESLKKSAFGGFIWKFAERVGAQLVALIVSIVLARILTPDDYSVVGIVTIFFAFCNVFITGGLNTALIQKKDADQEDYSTIFWVNMIIGAVLYLIMFFASPLIATIYHKELLVPIIRVMGIIFFINGIKAVLSAHISSTLQFKKSFLSTVVGTVVSAVIGIFMAVKGYGAWALVAQQISSALIDTIILFITTRYRVKLVLSVKKLKELLQFGSKMFIASLISVLYDQINPLIVGLRFTSTDLAFYTKGRSFPLLLNDTITGSLSAVLFPVISKKQDDKTAVLSMTRRYIGIASYVVFPIMLGFFAVAENFVRVVLTDKWLFAVPYIQIFCLAYMFNIIQTGNLEAIKAIGRSDIVLKLEIIKKSLYFTVILLFVWFTDSPEMLAVSSIICTMIATVVNTVPNRSLIGYRYREQIKDILPNLLLASIMGGTVLVINELAFSPVMVLLIQLLVGAILYVVLSVITKNENFVYVLNMIKMIIRGKQSIPNE